MKQVHEQSNGKLVDLKGHLIVVSIEDTDNTPKPKNKPGRPINPTSQRQQRLKLCDEKRESGTFKQGRPIVIGSDRQQRLQIMELKKEAGIEIKRGRPKLVEVILEGKVVKIQEGTIL